MTDNAPHTAEYGALRPAVPDLEFRCPECPICGRETDSDGDGFDCHNCEASWGRDGQRGEWFDRDEPGCPSVIEWWSERDLKPENEHIRHERDRCILGRDHTAHHRGFDSWMAWDDDDPRQVDPRTSPGGSDE